MFRGAKTWARRSTFAAVERERRLADADEAGAPNDESDVDVDDDVVAGASTRSCPRGDWITPRIEAVGIRRGSTRRPRRRRERLGTRQGLDVRGGNGRSVVRGGELRVRRGGIHGAVRATRAGIPRDPSAPPGEDAEGRRGAARRVRRPRPLPRPLVSRRVSGRAPGLGESALGGCRGDDVLVARVSGRPRAVWVWMVLPARVVETPGEVTAQVPAGMPVPSPAAETRPGRTGRGSCRVKRDEGWWSRCRKIARGWNATRAPLSRWKV